MKTEEMKFSEYLYYVRKRDADCRTLSLLAARTKIPRFLIQNFEKGLCLPTMAQLIAICEIYPDEKLRKKGEVEIEYAKTHPIVTIRFSDKTPCWKCGQDMKTVYGMVDEFPLSPDDFNEEMIRTSREKGVILEERRSGTTGETHLVNVCPNCGTFLGEFYLHELWYGETEIIPVKDVTDFIQPKEEW